MRIGLVSDTHLAPGGRAVGENCRAVRAWVARAGVDLTVHLGDVTAEGAAHAEHFAAAQDAFRDWPTPMRLLPGNHDVGDNHDIARSALEPAVDEGRLERWRDVFGGDRWRLSAGDWTVLGLDAQLLGWGSAAEAAQDAWLQAELDAAQGPIALFLHKPLFRNAPEDDERHLRYVPPAPRRRLLERFAEKDLRLVVCGHTHQLRRRRFQGCEHVWAPSCAFVIPDSMQETIGEKTVGVMLLTLSADSYSLDFIAPEGVGRHNLLDQMDIYPQLATRIGSQA
jgi:3',5'-cyclic AMP phosphodiesterase CpdA